MKGFITFGLAILLVTGSSAPVMAMKHMDHGSQDHGKSESMEHHGDMKHAEHGKHDDTKMEESHDMHAGHAMGNGDDFVDIGKDSQEGVTATVKIKTYDQDTRATMAKMGMDATHHVMVFFAEDKGGQSVSSGKVALKIKDTEGKSDKPVEMMLMGEGFGADVTVKDKGMYTLEVGTKLQDGNKRKFEVKFHNM